MYLCLLELSETLKRCITCASSSCTHVADDLDSVRNSATVYSLGSSRVIGSNSIMLLYFLYTLDSLQTVCNRRY